MAAFSRQHSMRPCKPMEKVCISPSCSPKKYAAQPASVPGGAAQPTSSTSGAARPTLTVGFYNVNIHSFSETDCGWKIIENRLESDIAKAFEVHALDILCLCGLTSNMPGRDLDAWIRRLLGGGVNSAEQPVSVYTLRQYSTIVKIKRVTVLEWKTVSNYVQDQPKRCFQHLRVSVGDDTDPISIVNCHAYSTKQHRLTAEGRLDMFMACQDACANDRFIWGGDFNTGIVQLHNLMQSINSSWFTAQSTTDGSLQLLYSHQYNCACKHGDVALIHGLRSVPTDSKVGAFYKGASTAHDLVVAKVFELRDLRPADSNAVRQSLHERITAATPPLAYSPSSAAQPATSSNHTQKSRTPRVDAIFHSDAGASQALQDVLEWITRDMLWDKVANIRTWPHGCYVAFIAPHITEKLEEFLRVVEEQRGNHLRRTPNARYDDTFNDDDMKEIYNTWINHHALWMNQKTHNDWKALRNRGRKGDAQQAHNKRRSAFSAYLFQIIGDKDLLYNFIKYPISSAAQPADDIRKFMNWWHEHKYENNDTMETDSHRHGSRSRSRSPP